MYIILIKLDIKNGCTVCMYKVNQGLNPKQWQKASSGQANVNDNNSQIKSILVHKLIEIVLHNNTEEFSAIFMSQGLQE